MHGGRVVNVPCSHVAHIESAGARSYRDSREWRETIKRNLRIVAEQWMGEYRKYFYFFNPALKVSKQSNVSTQTFK